MSASRSRRLLGRAQSLVGRRRVHELKQTAAGPDWRHAAFAALKLGRIYEARGMTSEARSSYKAALHSVEPVAAPAAGLALAGLLLEDGEEEAATAALTRTMAFRGSDAAAAALLLARLMLDRRDADAARPALRLAASTADADASARGALLLGQVLEAEGNAWGAGLLFEQAAQAADETRVARPRPRHDRGDPGTGAQGRAAGPRDSRQTASASDRAPSAHPGPSERRWKRP